MTVNTLNKYFNTNKEKYFYLLNNSTSVLELLLKIEIYGKKWTQWDWALFFSQLSFYIVQFNKVEDMQNSEKLNMQYLYDDIIDTIDNGNELDKILTNKIILSSIIYTLLENGNYSDDTKKYVYKMIAHIFKKYPKLWNISWMWTKYYDKNLKKWKKQHKLYRITTYITDKSTSVDYQTKQTFYNDFQMYFLN